MAKRDMDNLTDQPFPKRKKIEAHHMVFVGRSANLTAREEKVFDAVVNLITKTKSYPACTSSDSLLHRAGNAMFLEYSIEHANLYLCLKCYTGPEIKFLVHPVYMIESLPDAKRPLLAFSENFVDGESWRIIKSAFTHIFGGVVSPSEDHDFMFAFSRRGDFVHLRSYKILNVPNSSTMKKRLKLSTQCLHLSFMVVSFPVIETRAKPAQSIDLSEANVYIGPPTSNMGLLHSAVLNGSVIHLALDDVVDLSSWKGFGTCLVDFMERNVAMVSHKILGSGDAVADHPNDRYLLVIRSILLEMVALHKGDLCFSNITADDICLCGTKVKISWKVKLHKYEPISARSNYKAIKVLIAEIFKDFNLPRDMQVLIQLLDADYLTPGEHICTHVSLMNDISKSHLINDIFVLYTRRLLSRHRLLIAEPFSERYLNGLKGLISSNKYFAAVRRKRKGMVIPEGGESVHPKTLHLPVQEIDGAQAAGDKGGLLSRHDKKKQVGKIIGTTRNANVHIDDYMEDYVKNKGQVQQETVRIITHTLPDLLHTLQSELRNIVGDHWFAKYFQA